MSDDDLGTLRWFGESWGAPVNDPRARVETPVGAICPHHHGDDPMIKPGDQGVTVPYYDGSSASTLAYHLDCWLHDLGIPRP